MTISDSLISLDTLPSLLAACLVLLLGTILSKRVGLLARYSIPSPIIGGVLFAIAAAVLIRTTGQASRWRPLRGPTFCWCSSPVLGSRPTCGGCCAAARG